MKLVETKCPNCGSSVKVEVRKKKATCEYCGANFLLDDNTIKVKHIKAGEITEEQEYINAETNLNKLKNYEEAYEIYLSLSKRYVDNSEIWIGLLRCLTKDFSYKYGTLEFKKLYQEYWRNYIALAEKDEIEKYSLKYKNYVDNVKASGENENKFIKEEKCLILATLLGGMLGIHKFIKGQIGLGVLYLFTFGLFGIGWIMDVVNEYKKWPESNQKQIVKWILMVFFIIIALNELKYSFVAFILFILAALLTIDFIWDILKIKNILLRIVIPLVLFIVAMELSSTVIPESSYGKWITSDKTASYQIVEFSSDDVKIYKTDDSKNYISMFGEYYESKIYLSEDDIKLVFSYDVLKDELCLLNEQNECTISYSRLDEKQED